MEIYEATKRTARLIEDPEFKLLMPILHYDLTLLLQEIQRLRGRNEYWQTEVYRLRGEFRANPYTVTAERVAVAMNETQAAFGDFKMPANADLAAACGVPEHLLCGTEAPQTGAALREPSTEIRPVEAFVAGMLGIPLKELHGKG